MKLKLDLDELTVDSFQTADAEKPRGTVVGRQGTFYTNCSCPGQPTCAATCLYQYTCGLDTCPDCPSCGTPANTCGNTCGDTCEGCTMYDATCNGYGTCGRYPCRQVP